MNDKVERHVILSDLHYPEHSESAVSAVFDFVKHNKVGGVILLGDNMDCQDVSRHTAGKPRLRKTGGYKADLDGFDEDILTPLEAMTGKSTKKVFFMGNHEDWIEDLLDAQPELQGVVDLAKNLRLAERGWKVIPCGGLYEVGRIAVVHGDRVGSGQYVAKKMVDSFCQTSVMGHVHTFSVFTKTSAIKERSKWIGVTLPCLSTLSPGYSKGKNNAWLHGFGIIESWGPGFGNIYVPIIVRGQFSFGGRLYGKKSVPE